MGCEICGRNACTKSFHSDEEQNEHDNVSDKVKDRLKQIIESKVNQLKGHYFEDDGDYYIKLDDVIEAIQDAD